MSLLYLGTIFGSNSAFRSAGYLFLLALHLTLMFLMCTRYGNLISLLQLIRTFSYPRCSSSSASNIFCIVSPSRSFNASCKFFAQVMLYSEMRFLISSFFSGVIILFLAIKNSSYTLVFYHRRSQLVYINILQSLSL